MSFLRVTKIWTQWRLLEMLMLSTMATQVASQKIMRLQNHFEDAARNTHEIWPVIGRPWPPNEPFVATMLSKSSCLQALNSEGFFWDVFKMMSPGRIMSN